MLRRQSVFVSAPSRDLKSAREAVKAALLDAAVLPRTQEHFPPDHRELVAYLRGEISKADAMICLAGDAFGSAPIGGDPPTRSYAQIEYDTATELGKDIYVFLPTEQFIPDTRPQQSQEESEHQRQHRARLMKEHRCSYFSSLLELQLKVTQLLLVPGFRGRPAVAVLPFDNLSGDPEQEYFADGIADDLLTRIARIRLFPVIARSSCFSYKGSTSDTVSRELGARYIVGGSIQRTVDRVRINAHLTEVKEPTALDIWSNMYDRRIVDIFELQDEIAEDVVTAIQPRIMQSEYRRVISSNPQSMDAWDCVMRGLWHSFKFTREDTLSARHFAQRAVELEPTFAEAFALIAATHFTDLFYQWTTTPAEAFSEARRAAEESVRLDPEGSVAQTILGFACAFSGQLERAVETLTHAVEVNPSFSLGFYGLGVSHMIAGRPEDAVSMISKAIRLSPRDPMLHQFLLHLGQAHFLARQYKEALVWVERSLALRPDSSAYRILAASHGHLGNAAEGRVAIDALMKRDPDFSPDKAGFADTSDLIGLYLSGWRRTGWRG